MSTVQARRISSLLARTDRKACDLYDNTFPDNPAPNQFWEKLAHLEQRLQVTLDKEHPSSMDLKMAEMAYTRGLKRICREQQARTPDP